MLAGLADFLREFYAAPFRGAVARAKRQEDDLFMLLVFSEMVGVPNPASYFTLELQPLLYEDFHEWHKRMGMEHSPLEGFHCC
ncbi:MAG: DNA helicase [Gemmatimonadota bacterium]|nr:DNA helicase [Gemmatimonadota bacterium]MDH3421527.1 DNA helicase [Gemmatimonadota bacterium]